MTARGECIHHGKARQAAELDDLHYHRGDYFQAWRRACVASYGGVLLDDLMPTE